MFALKWLSKLEVWLSCTFSLQSYMCYCLEWVLCAWSLANKVRKIYASDLISTTNLSILKKALLADCTSI